MEQVFVRGLDKGCAGRAVGQNRAEFARVRVKDRQKWLGIEAGELDLRQFERGAVKRYAFVPIFKQRAQ